MTWPQCPAGGSFHSPPPATCWMTIWGSGKPHDRGRIIFLVAGMDNNKSQEICRPNLERSGGRGGGCHCSCLLFGIKCAQLLFNGGLFEFQQVFRSLWINADKLRAVFLVMIICTIIIILQTPPITRFLQHVQLPKICLLDFLKTVKCSRI